jgi:transposase-like protein
MATRTRRTWTPRQKAEALLLLAQNEGNVKRTARQLNIAPSVMRDWRDRSKEDPDFAVEAAKSDVFEEMAPKYQSVIEKHLTLINRGLDAAINSGEVPELKDLYRLAGTMNMLTQNLGIMKGEATGRTEHVHTLDLTDVPNQLQAIQQDMHDMRDKAVERARVVKAIQGETFDGEEEVDALPHDQE